MTNGRVPPIPHQEKKGLGPWVWLGIGCAGILALSAVAFAVAGYFIYGKAKDVAREMEEDPVAATSRLIAAANPEIELVDADKSNRTITFRNTETGEEFTFDYDDIEEGRFSFTSGDESASIEFNAEGDTGGGRSRRATDRRRSAPGLQSNQTGCPCTPGPNLREPSHPRHRKCARARFRSKRRMASIKFWISTFPSWKRPAS